MPTYPYISLTSACEKSVVEHISASFMNVCSSSYSGEVNIYTGVNNVEKEAPAIIVSCEQGSELYKGTNVYDLTLSVKVKELASEVTNIGELAPLVFNSFFDPNKETNFTNSKYNFAVQGMETQLIRTEIEGDTLINEMTFRLVGCLS